MKKHWLLCLIIILCGTLSVVARYFNNVIFLVNVLENICVALLVSGFILRYIEKQDREIFHHEIINVQKQTAQDAIQSVFQRLIDKNTFEMIQKDIFQGKFVRKNVTWKYTIKKKDENNKEITLTRIIQYTLKNITQETQNERFYIYSDSTNIHCKLTCTKISVKQNKQWEELSIKKDEKGKEYREVKLEEQKELEVSLEMIEKFNETLDYIYAVHSPRFGMVGLKLDVSFPEDYEFEIVVDAFSNKLEEIPSKIQGQRTYQTDKAIYKGQAIEFICYPKTNQTQIQRTPNDNQKYSHFISL